MYLQEELHSNLVCQIYIKKILASGYYDLETISKEAGVPREEVLLVLAGQHDPSADLAQALESMFCLVNVWEFRNSFGCLHD